MRLSVLVICYLQINLSVLAENAWLKCIGADEATGTSKAVIVDANAALVHTRQVFGFAARTPAKQAEDVLNNLEAILNASRSDLTNVAKLNIYLAEAKALPQVRKVLAKRFAGVTKPAASFVITVLPNDSSMVAADAVATISADSTEKHARFFDVVSEVNVRPMFDGAILPAGPRIYVSGMADTNRLPEAAKRTIEKLTAALGHLGLKKSDIVQVKAFLQPMSQAGAVQKAILDFFGGEAPPTIFVEWISPPPNPPIEIELIAVGKSAETNVTNSVTYLTPPGTTSTKVFSRVAQVNHGNLIYISGLYGMKAQSPDDEVSEIFQSLGEILPTTGSDFEHLVKATYYVSDDLAGEKLNEIRSQFYNPLRPPAASKAKVQGVAEQRTVTVDMIAVRK